MAEGSTIPATAPVFAQPHGEKAFGDAAFRFLADSVSDVIVQADLGGTLLYVSPACRTWGYQPRELIGRPATDLVHPDDLERFSANSAQAMAGPEVDRSLDRAIRYRRKDGGWVWLEGNPEPMRDAEGRLVGLVNVLRDVTERRRLLEMEAEKARFETLAHTISGVGYWWLDVATGKLTWSDQMFVTYGLPPGDEPDLRAAMAAIHPEDRAGSDERMRRALLTGEGWTDVLGRIVRPGGEIRHVESRGVCERDAAGVVHRVFGAMVLDVTERKRAETAASEAEAERRANVVLFENAFHHAPIGMALVGLDGRFLKINAAFCDLIGYPETQALTLDFQTITHPDDLAADLGLLSDLSAGKIPRYRMEKRYLRADGALVWVQLSVSMVTGEAGEPKHYIAQVEDLTAARTAKQALALSEQRFRRLADNAPDMVSESKLDGALTYVSPASLAITGYAPEELIGQTYLALMHPDDGEKVMAMCRTVFASKGAIAPWPVEFRARHKDGNEIWLECKPTLATDPLTGRFTGLNDVIRDVTARKALEADLRATRAEAEAAAAIKGEFLANMSHEIRTPLTAILGFASLLSERQGLDEIGRGHLQRVLAASQSLLSIVDDILDFSRLEAGRVDLTPKPVALGDSAHEILLMFAPQAEAKGLTLDFIAENDLPCHVALDPERFRQVLFNLIGNAIKFTGEGGVRLRLAYETALERLSVTVEDFGPGISTADQARLFQRFAQVDGSSTRQHGGTGLGLAICKGLIEAMGGQIGVLSKLGHGSAFMFHIPAPLAEAPVVTDADEAGGGLLGDARVLVVDDNPVNRELARAILENAGAEVTLANDGSDALSRIAEAPFDVILLDRRMPGMGGEETLRRIRAEPGPNDSIPILAFSADTDLDGLLGPGGFDDLVGKPINAIALIETIARWTQWGAMTPPVEVPDAAAV